MKINNQIWKKIIKKSKKRKILILAGFISGGLITTTAIVLNDQLSKNNAKTKKNNHQLLISKIKDKDLIINKDVDTSSDAKILLAIKNQLKAQNPLLNDEDLTKITDNITSLTPGVKTNVVLTILIDNESSTVNIKVTRPLSDLESINNVKTALKNLAPKEITIVATSGTITNNKKAIFDELNLLIKSSKIDLKGTNIAIKNEDIRLTLKGVPFTILISKGAITEEISSEFIVKRVKSNVEKNKRKIALIKSKIKVRTFDIEKNVDTSNDEKTLLAIKNQLKVENPLLTDEDLAKIDDNITSLVSYKKTSVTLIISIGSERDTVKIAIERYYSDLESVDKTKYALEKKAPNEITISATSGTITDNKDLIVKTLKKDYWLSVILGTYRTNISIKEENTRLTLEGVPFTILVYKGAITKEISSSHIVKRSKTTQEINNDKVNAIKNKIVDKDLIINKDVDTSNDAKILTAIKNQIRIQNPLLTNEDLVKITDNISSLTPGVKTNVDLTILVGSKSDIVKIWIERALNDTESVNAVKNKLENLVPKEITISAVSGTITEHKMDILNALNSLISSSNIDLKETIISIKNENTELTLNGVFFTILISKENITQEITNWKVKRSKTIQEKNQDKVNAIKNKIVDKDLIINKDVDTSNDAKILIAIKNQLKIQNPLLNDEDLLNITDNISSLIPGVKTNVVLTFPIAIEFNMINIQVTRPLTDLESVVVVKDKIINKDLIINKNVDTSNDTKILLAIKHQLKVENPSLSNEDLAKITDNITSLVPGKITPVILRISVGTVSNEINIKVVKSSNDFESTNVLKNAFESLTPKEIQISATSGTITDNKEAIINALHHFLTRYSNLDYLDANISVKEEDTELTLKGVPFTILISKGNATQEITDWKVKKSKTIQEINNDKVNAIKNKIVDKDLIIDKNVDTSDDAKILVAIKHQLRVENPSLNVENLSKITDNITSLVPKKITPVILTISVGSQSDNIKIQVIRHLSDFELVNEVKNTLLAGFSQKILVKVTGGTITDNKEVILDALNSIIKFLNLDLKGTTISIKEEDTELTLSGVLFTVLISKGSTTEEVISKFIVARIESIQEIKNKITDKELIINKDVDTSNGAKILIAIKNQLKLENPSLSNDNLLKITDNINSLVPGLKTNVILTISIGNKSDTIDIKVTKSSNDFESVSAVKNELENLSLKEVTINANSGTITDNKKAILSAFKLLINHLKVDLKGTTIAIKEENTQLTSTRTPFTILISKGIVNQEIVSKFIVFRTKNKQEIDRIGVNITKRKIVNKDLIIDKNVDPIIDEEILAAIKHQLKVQNPALHNKDLSKITDDISYLQPGVKTDVVLTITDGSASDTVNVKVTKPACTPSDRCDIK